MKQITLLIMGLLLPVFSLGTEVLAQQNQQKTYYPINKGMKWYYQLNAGNRVIEMINTIAKIDNINGEALSLLETQVNGQIVASEHLTSTQKGVFRHRFNGSAISPPVKLLQYPFKKGDSWKAKIKIGSDTSTYSAEVLNADEMVTVAAGKYKTVRVKLDLVVPTGQTITTTYWFAPGVGIVKQSAEFAPNMSMVLELKNVEKPK